MPEDIKVLLVGDIGKRAELRKEFSEGIVVAAEAGYGTEAFTAARQTPADLAIVVMEEPVARPLRTIESLTAGERATPAIVVSSLSHHEHIRKAMLAGARDFLVKPSGKELRQAIVNVYETEQRRQEMTDHTAGQDARAEVIVIFGAKGGIGKSTLAVNLAVAVEQLSKQRVALVDLDTQLGDIAVMMDTVPDRTIVDAAEMIDRLEPQLIQTLMREDPSGIHVLAGPMRPQEGEFISAHHVSKIVEVLASTYDYVIVDTAPHFTDALVTTLDAATMLLLVTTPDVAALKNTKLALGIVKSWNYSADKVKLVVNNAYTNDGASSDDVVQLLDYQVFWRIPNDPAVAAAAKAGKPLVTFKPKARAAQSIEEMARKLCGIEKPKRGLFHR